MELSLPTVDNPLVAVWSRRPPNEMRPPTTPSECGRRRAQLVHLMLTGIAMAAAADSLQAQHLRQCLSEERVELAAKLAKHAKILTEYDIAGDAQHQPSPRTHSLA
jgi:hypothetical protein